MNRLLPSRALIAAATPRGLVRRALLHFICLVALFSAAASTACAQAAARFDLTGPRVEVRVTRSGVTLPIASVPNLQPGDRLWLHPDLPSTQSVRYLMVLVFLRGTTNPPPDNWFYRIETWDKRVREEGAEIAVPDEAQQAVLFLAPVTGGDFSTLRSAVQGRPGIFVRASQDLAAAGFEQARIEKYIASMSQLSPAEAADPRQLQEHSNLIAATLALKPNADCVKLPPEQQYTCLTQTGTQSLLDDGHGQSIVDALTSGTGAGLIGTASATQLAGGGIYSAYVGTVVDLVHIMGSLHTAQYQYIPAVAFPEQQSLNLRLNTPPSFHNPKSVIVIGLPSIQQTIPPPLRAADPNQVSCLQQPGVVLPVEGAPLVFSTGFAHDLVLHLNYPPGAKSSQPQDIALTADAFRGGLVLSPIPKRRALPAERLSHSKSPATADNPAASTSSTAQEAAAPNPLAAADLTGTVQGFWGFDTFTGPTMPLQDAPGKDWKVAGNDSAGGWVIAGKDRHILLTSTGTACVQSIEVEPTSGKREKAAWKLTEGSEDKPSALDVTLDVPLHESGAMHLAIRQFGDPKPATVSLVSYNEPAKLDALNFHAGDTTAVLTGTGLDQVRQVEFGGLTLKPAKDDALSTLQSSGRSGATQELHLELPPDAKAPKLSVDQDLTGRVALTDGRTLNLPLTVQKPRPSVTLIGRADVPPETGSKGQLNIRLASQNDLPVSDALMFSLKSAQPFPRSGAIDIASPDGSLHTTLSLSSDSLILEDPQTLLATLQPLKAFGPSAFGPVRMRPVAPDGTAGEWLPLVTLVRLPTLTGLSCPVAAPAVPVRPAKPHRSPAIAPAASPATPDPATTPTETSAATPDSATPTTAAASSSTPSPTASESAAPSAAPASTPSAPATSPATTAAAAPPVSCTLTGSGLYFIDSVATNSAFTDAVRVPDGFVGSSLSVPAPTGAVYYLRLRDDPAPADTVTLPAGPLGGESE